MTSREQSTDLRRVHFFYDYEEFRLPYLSADNINAAE
jgi:hypothetical protein